MIDTDFDTTFDRSDLITKLESAPIGIPIEVERLLANETCSSILQWLDSVCLLFKNREERLARQIAGVVNGIILTKGSTGYLVFRTAESSLGVKQDESSSLITFANYEAVEQAVDDLIKKHVQPASSVGYQYLKNNDIGYFEITSNDLAPVHTFGTTGSGQIKLITPLWKKVNGRWRISNATPEETSELYREFFVSQLSAQTGDQSLDEESRNELSIEFKRQLPRSNYEFAGFLASLLLRAIPEERALAATLFGMIGGIAERTRKLIAQLLLALLRDDQIVAKQVVKSLEMLGDPEHVQPILQSLDRHAYDSDLSSLIFKCIGELGTPQSVELLASLAIDGESYLNQDRDAAIARLYERHNIPTHDPLLRQDYLTLIKNFQYGLALDALRDNGPNICLAQIHRSLLENLTQYAQLRKSFDFAGAAEICAILLNSQFIEKIEIDWEYWQRETQSLPLLQDAQKQGVLAKKLLAEKFFGLDCAYLARNYAEFAARFYSYVDDITKHLAIRHGVSFSPGGERLDPDWICANPDLIEYLRSRKFNPKKKHPDRFLLRAIFERGEQDTDTSEAVEILTRFESVIDLRHKLPISHGSESSAGKRFEEAYGSNFQDMISDIRHLHFLITQEELGENPYLKLNNDLEYLLSSADTVPPTSQSLAKLEVS